MSSGSSGGGKGLSGIFSLCLSSDMTWSLFVFVFVFISCSTRIISSMADYGILCDIGGGLLFIGTNPASYSIYKFRYPWSSSLIMLKSPRYSCRLLSSISLSSIYHYLNLYIIDILCKCFTKSTNITKSSLGGTEKYLEFPF